MTSFLIDKFRQRELEAQKSQVSSSSSPIASQYASKSFQGHPECTFCQLIESVQGRTSSSEPDRRSHNPLSPPSLPPPPYIVYEDAYSIAFLDIYPIRAGHVLLVPKSHVARLHDMPPTLSAALGTALQAVATGVSALNPEYNVVNNNGYAQTVDHVHFHLVPAPGNGLAGKSASNSTDNASKWIFKPARQELDDDEAARICLYIREGIAKAHRSKL